MKKILSLLLVILSFHNVEAQVAHWALHPNFDRVEFLENGLFLVSKDGKCGVMGKNDQMILPLKYDSISNFHNGLALVYSKKNNQLVGFTDTAGHFTNVEEKNFFVDLRCPHFADGFLLVYTFNEEKDRLYYFINKETHNYYGPYIDAVPMNEGFAPVKVPLNQKKPHNGKFIITYFSGATGEITNNFGNNIDTEDIGFASSLNSGKSIIVVKKQFYEYDFNTSIATPLSTDHTNNKKSLVVSSNRDIFIHQETAGFSVLATNAKFSFDYLHRLVSIEMANKTKTYNVPTLKVPAVKTDIDRLLTDRSIKVGLTFKGEEVLPQQFDEVLKMKGSSAIVKVGGRCGVVEVDKDRSFMFKLNDGKDVGFEHQSFLTRFIASLPPYIAASTAKVECQNDDCEFKVETRQDNENIEATSISYDCNLFISKDITETLSPFTYSFVVYYDGLCSKPYSVTINEWFVKSYEVIVNDYHVSEGVVTVNFETVKSPNVDNNHVQKVVEVEPEMEDHLSKVEKLNEDTFIARLYGVNSSTVSFSIDITENGCPTVSYPFTIKMNDSTSKTQTADKKSSSKKTVSKGGKVVKKKNKPKKIDSGPLFVPN